jgi:hypothetical protein
VWERLPTKSLSKRKARSPRPVQTRKPANSGVGERSVVRNSKQVAPSPKAARKVVKPPSGRGVRVAGPAEAIAQVTAVLQGYADKAVFRGFGPGPVKGATAIFIMVWHHDRRFELVVDAGRGTFTFPLLLPGIPKDSSMYREFKAFLDERRGPEVPPHRRIDPSKALVACTNRAGNVGLTLTLQDGDFDYGARKIIFLVDEIFKIFLIDGPYFDYLVEQLGLDPDRY